MPARESVDPYSKALQQALVKQYLGRMQTGGAGGYRIGPHDLIEVRVFGYDKMNTVARVGDDGDVNFAPLGAIRAEGLTERQLEAVLQDRLRGKYLQDPHVTVYVKEPHTGEVAIVGEVRQPGRYLLLGEKRLVDLLTEAGGMTEKAGNFAYVIRFNHKAKDNPGQNNPAPDGAGDASRPATSATLLSEAASEGTRIKIDLEGLLLRGEEHWNIALMSGDLVNVPEAGSVHVTGPGVNKPGTYALTRSAKTLRQMIDEAGGLKFEASMKVLLLRKRESGADEVVTVDYAQVLNGRRSDIVLRSGDMVVTGRTPVRTALASVGKTFGSLIRFGMYGSWNVPIGQ